VSLEQGLFERSWSGDPQKWDAQLEHEKGYFVTPWGNLIEENALRKLWNLEEEIAALQANLHATADPYSWEGYGLPDSETQRRKVLDELVGALYFKEEATKFFASAGKEQRQGDVHTISVKPIKELSPETQDILIKAKLEMESIYDAIKIEVGFSGRNPEAEERRWQEVAENHFKQRRNEFKFIRLDDLQDRGIYLQLGTNQGKRDFVGPLLKKIVKRHTQKEISSQRLYDAYKKVNT